MSALSALFGPGGPGAGPGPVGPGPGPAAAPPLPKSDGDWEEDLRNALSALRQAAADAPDHQEAAIVDKCVAAIQGILASRQKGAESALGVTPAHKAMSRAY